MYDVTKSEVDKALSEFWVEREEGIFQHAPKEELAKIYPVTCKVYGAMFGDLLARYEMGHTKFFDTVLKDVVPIGSVIRDPACMIKSEDGRLFMDGWTASEALVKAKMGNTDDIAYIKAYALQLFLRAARVAKERELILASADIEFGVNEKDEVFATGQLFSTETAVYWEKRKLLDGTVPDNAGENYPMVYALLTDDNYLEEYRRIHNL